jgi:adenosylcobinamide-GDP ribazoletransferase
VQTLTNWLRQLGGALVFYTILPLPQHWPLEFAKIARWAPWIGGLIGGILTLVNYLLHYSSASDFLRGVMVTALWIVLTGGLHLDGVMDTADGLAVPDPERRLSVMSDSRTGAYGAMAAIVLILLKVAAIADLPPSAALWMVPIWGRWAQWLAIARYPYLKVEGKGAFHRQSLMLPQDLWPSLFLFLIVVGISLASQPHQWRVGLGAIALSLCLSWGVGAWFNHRFNGMTGDIYGAITEWTETFILCSLSFLANF